MKTIEVLMQMMFICDKMLDEKNVRLVLFPDFSGRMSYDYSTGYEMNESILFRWGENYSDLLKNFVNWLEKQK